MSETGRNIVDSLLNIIESYDAIGEDELATFFRNNLEGVIGRAHEKALTENAEYDEAKRLEDCSIESLISDYGFARYRDDYEESDRIKNAIIAKFRKLEGK